MIHVILKNINRLFVLSFKAGRNDPTRNSFDKYYLPLVEIIEFKTLIENKLFFSQRVKNKQEIFKKFVKMSRSNDHTTGNLLDLIIQIIINLFT